MVKKAKSKTKKKKNIGGWTEKDQRVLEDFVAANQKVDGLKITLKSLGRTFESVGETFEEAIEKIKIGNGARLTSVLIVEKDGIKKERILGGRTTGHLFGGGSPTAKQIHLKQVKRMFDL